MLCYSPDRLARKFAYQALLIEEFARAGTRVQFVNRARAATPRRTSCWCSFRACSPSTRRHRSSSVTGAARPTAPDRVDQRALRRPVRLPLRPQERPRRRRLRGRRARGGAGHRAVPPLRRRRRLHRRAGPLAHRAGRADPHRQAALGPLGDLGHAAQPRLRRPRGVRQDHGRARIPRAEPGRATAGTIHAPRVQDRRPAPRSVDRDRRPGDRDRRDLRAGHPAPCRQQAVRLPQQQNPLAAAGPGRLLGLRIRLLPHLDPHHEQEDLLLPVPGLGRLPIRGRPGLHQQTGPRRLPRHRGLGPHHRNARRSPADPHRDRQTARQRAHLRPGRKGAKTSGGAWPKPAPGSRA